jgi:hypothetical protein
MFSTAKIIKNDYLEWIQFSLDTGLLKTVDEQWRYCNSVVRRQWIDPPIWFTPLPIDKPQEAQFPTVTGTLSASVVMSPSYVVTAIPGPLPGASGDTPLPPVTPFLNPAAVSGRPSGPDAYGILIEGTRIEAKPTVHTVPTSVVSDFLKDGVGQFSHSVQNLDQPGRSSSYNPILSQWVYTEANAVFSVHDAGVITASQIKPGLYAVDGTTFSQGGTAINFQGSVITAYDSGVIVMDGSQHINLGGQLGSNAVFTAGTGVATVSQLQSGVYVIQGTTFSKGGSAISFQGSVITAGESGVIVIDGSRHTGVGGLQVSSTGVKDGNNNVIVNSNSEDSKSNLEDGKDGHVSEFRHKGGAAALYANWPLWIFVSSLLLISNIT